MSRASSTRTSRAMHRARASAASCRSPASTCGARRTARYVCFEVNPSPAFSFYERRTGLPIATAIARYLAGENRTERRRRIAYGELYIRSLCLAKTRPVRKWLISQL